MRKLTKKQLTRRRRRMKARRQRKCGTCRSFLDITTTVCKRCKRNREVGAATDRAKKVLRGLAGFDVKTPFLDAFRSAQSAVLTELEGKHERACPRPFRYYGAGMGDAVDVDRAERSNPIFTSEHAELLRAAGLYDAWDNDESTWTLKRPEMVRALERAAAFGRGRAYERRR